MSDEEKETLGDDDFEAGLRDILSHGPAGAARQPVPQRVAEGVRDGIPKGTLRGFATDPGRLEREKKAIFWLNMLRPLAVLAVLGLLAIYVFRIFIN
ncbi:MAG: hypothetical protein FWC23_03895 [Chitinispirillia bacterium]|nr:hypothetical protein [Chitinispirillia bacterium]MCL2268313.1 hypothetical protein [Chitinispirillia bacterium]